MARVKRAVARRSTAGQPRAGQGLLRQQEPLVPAANEQVMHAGQYAFRDRRARKGDFRTLWIQRINAGVPPERHQLQPVHRRPARRRDRGRPQGPRRPRRQRSGGVHRAGRAPRKAARSSENAGRDDSRRPDPTRRAPSADPAAAAPLGRRSARQEDRRLRDRGPGARARGARAPVAPSRRSSSTPRRCVDRRRWRAGRRVVADGVLERVATTVTPRP